MAGSVTVPPGHRVDRLIPFVHVEDVARSLAFYQQLGFVPVSVYRYRERPVWAALRSGAAELMQEAVAKNFVGDAFAHLKLIGYTKAAAALLEKSAVDLDDTGGMSLTEGTAGQFVVPSNSGRNDSSEWSVPFLVNSLKCTF